MNTHLRDEVIRLLSPHMIITRSDVGTFVFRPQNPRIQDNFPDLDVMKRDISRMTLSEAKRAGIVMYGDASFSIDAYEVARFQGFAHFVAALIVHETRGVHDLRDVELDPFEPERIRMDSHSLGVGDSAASRVAERGAHVAQLKFCGATPSR
ncbi:hypothetical protein [Hyalangium minutum]|nr:hypothetical protein [Hyalangium minutum]